MIDNLKAIGSDIKRAYDKDKYFASLFLMLFAILAVITMVKPEKFFSMNNFQSMAYQFPQFGLMAIGIMLTMISSGIDLSVVAIANLSSITAALIMRSMVHAGIMGDGQVLLIILFAVAVAMLVGFILGSINGLLISRIGIPAILATLGSMQLFTGISIVLTGGKGLQKLPPLYSKIGNAALFYIIPVPLVIFIVCVIAVGFLLNKTTYGRKLFMVGTNETAARFSGLDTKKLFTRTYMYSGILASIAGLIMMARMNSAKADYGADYTLQCILIVVLGGVKPEGGFGRIGGVTLAILILQFLSSAINMFPAINNFYRVLLWGAALLVVMLFQYLSSARSNRALSGTKESKGLLDRLIAK